MTNQHRQKSNAKKTIKKQKTMQSFLFLGMTLCGCLQRDIFEYIKMCGFINVILFFLVLRLLYSQLTYTCSNWNVCTLTFKFVYSLLKLVTISPTNEITYTGFSGLLGSWSFGWAVGEMLCHILVPQFSSNLNVTCYTWSLWHVDVLFNTILNSYTRSLFVGMLWNFIN